MNHKLGLISYTLATLASVCLVSGLLVLTGGDSSHDGLGNYRISDRRDS